MFTRSILGAALVFVSGCAGEHNALTKAQECATELNTNARFGRMQLATEYVAPKERKGFLERHAGWGSRVRVLDAELIGIDLVSKGEKEKDETLAVSVKVAWTFVDDQDLRVTMVSQQWKRSGGDGWSMTKEERADGDPGLFGDKVVVLAPPPRATQFATIRID